MTRSNYSDEFARVFIKQMQNLGKTQLTLRTRRLLNIKSNHVQNSIFLERLLARIGPGLTGFCERDKNNVVNA